MQHQQQPSNSFSASRPSPPPFRCTRVRRSAGTVHVCAAGELDMASTPVLREVLHAAQASARVVVLDLHELTFIDCAGLHVLEESSLEALSHGKRLVLARLPAHVMRAVELCGLVPPLEVIEREPAQEAGRRLRVAPPAEAPRSGAWLALEQTRWATPALAPLRRVRGTALNGFVRREQQAFRMLVALLLTVAVVSSSLAVL